VRSSSTSLEASRLVLVDVSLVYPARCPSSFHTTSSPAQYHHHCNISTTRSVKMSNRYRCRMCQHNGQVVQFRTKGNVIAHLGTVHSMGPYRCSVCPHTKCRAYVTSTCNSHSLCVLTPSSAGTISRRTLPGSKRLIQLARTVSRLSTVPPG
jgi:hypothetical protein